MRRNNGKRKASRQRHTGTSFDFLDYFLSVYSFGKEIEGRVYGYVDDNVFLNDRPAQVYKDRFSIAKSKNFDAWQ